MKLRAGSLPPRPRAKALSLLEEWSCPCEERLTGRILANLVN